MQSKNMKRWFKGILSGGGIVVYFIMAFEVMIMISPFAFFFYSVFNPIFHLLGKYSATRWLTGFFLPHTVFPPGVFLQGIRVLGSVLFILGLGFFLICASQVYLGKILKRGVATKGLYQVIRHPQYLGLAICGAGMAILWPRFLVLVTLSLMLILYYFLARDEERRMTNEYGDAYQRYMEQTGMFLPRWIERPVTSNALSNRLKPYQSIVFPLVTVVTILVLGFALRTLTVAELPVKIEGNIAVVSMLPEDNGFLKGAASNLSGAEGKLPNNLILNQNEAYLGYLMPVDYVMQGMIANTGKRWQLYKRHHALQMISDWVFHPFRHLRQPPMHTMQHMPTGHTIAMARRHLCPLNINDPTLECNNCPYRRVVIVQVDKKKKRPLTKALLFALRAERTAVAYLDMDVRSGKIIDVVRVQGKTLWEEVPTPIF
ncbi:MAG: methyltransferase family protein [bacterium]